MLLKTHKVGGVATAILTTPYIHNYVDSELAYVFALGVTAVFAKIGAEIPDLDLGWEQIKKKNSLWRSTLNRLFWLLGCKHRSWQTHCYTITLIPLLIPILMLLQTGLTGVSSEALFWILCGLEQGILSHLILDSFNPKGVHLIPNKIIRFVPKKIAIVTGSTMERWVRVLCIGLCIYGAFDSFNLIKDSVLVLTSIL